MNGCRLAPESQSSWIDVDEVRIHVSDWGGDESDCAVLLHPTGFLGAVWRPIITRMRCRGFSGRILTVDQRGHGLSSKPDEGYQWIHFENDLEAVLKALKIRGALAIGHSAGGTIGAGVAARFPERFRRVVLVDPILVDAATAEKVRQSGDHPMAARTRNRRLVWPSRDELFSSYRARSPYSTWSEEALRDYVDFGTFDRPDGEIELLCPGRLEAQVYENVGDPDGFERLAGVKVPVLIVRGETSDSFPVAGAQRALRALEQGRLIELAGCGHFMPMERPDEIADICIAESRA